MLIINDANIKKNNYNYNKTIKKKIAKIPNSYTLSSKPVLFARERKKEKEELINHS